MRWVIQGAKSLERGMCAGLVEVQTIIWKTAWLHNKVGPKDLAGIQQKKSRVRLLLATVSAPAYLYG